MTMRELRGPSFFVLLALVDGAKHGYAVLTEVERLSSGRVRLQVGSLYAVIDRLTGQGWIRVREEAVVGGRVRRYLELTDAGRTVLETETDRMEQDARVARLRLSPVTE